MSKNPIIQAVLSSPCAHLNKHLEDVTEVSRISKYGNVRTVVDEIKFASKREADRYKELQLLLKAGEIGFLKLQVPYELNEGGSYSYKYIADFVYVDARTGATIVEDCKGARTAVYKKKRKLMKKIYGIKILET